MEWMQSPHAPLESYTDVSVCAFCFIVTILQNYYDDVRPLSNIIRPLSLFVCPPLPSICVSNKSISSPLKKTSMDASDDDPINFLEEFCGPLLWYWIILVSRKCPPSSGTADTDVWPHSVSHWELYSDYRVKNVLCKNMWSEVIRWE